MRATAYHQLNPRHPVGATTHQQLTTPRWASRSHSSSTAQPTTPDPFKPEITRSHSSLTAQPTTPRWARDNTIQWKPQLINSTAHNTPGEPEIIIQWEPQLINSSQYPSEPEITKSHSSSTAQPIISRWGRDNNPVGATANQQHSPQHPGEPENILQALSELRHPKQILPNRSLGLSFLICRSPSWKDCQTYL